MALYGLVQKMIIEHIRWLKNVVREEEIPDLFPSLERTDSDNFYPTPPIYRWMIFTLAVRTLRHTQMMSAMSARQRRHMALSSS